LTINNEKSLQHIETNILKTESTWFLYIVETRFGHWYTGITTNVEKRFATHQAGKGAKTLEGKGRFYLSINNKLVIKVKQVNLSIN
jgi:putative endonuclease